LPVLACALLHDVLEDTLVTEREMNDFLKPLLGDSAAEKTVKLVIELTDVYVKSNYPR
jgi:(p)ppGpp synthase/HD superfamily hydrolase